MSTFLLRFQEPCVPGESEDVTLGTSTETRTREGRDQDYQGWAVLATKTAVREEPDQAQASDGYGVLPSRGSVTGRVILLGTGTETKAREENDQDRTNMALSTKTATGTREEDDADPSHVAYNVLPLGGS